MAPLRAVRLDIPAGECRAAAWRTDMKKRASLSHPALQYTAFLFEPLGDDRNGVPLALASILGRMNLDPWSEAASLAAMPAAVAKQKLAALIEAMPNHSWMRPESNTLAERLIRLLPAPRMHHLHRQFQQPPLRSRWPMLMRRSGARCSRTSSGSS